ncbi:MAG: diacylglycerol kinase family lipid kinase [candidate division KSB1 bacterium]|nr:diacylglycerol kinase family lipid kinase [candidate division KSB1 bacterium]MDZ7319356.1 diacylglycerol kinase family lipid kinase [candidate division KSB1 bacterium]MDZ7340762.1 diacylglycerol kinase family lipid kinase [candidate division KSB1 bacterium]
MSQPEWIFIINPVAGNGLAGQYAATVEEQIRQHQLNAAVKLTERRGHATEIARESARTGSHHIIGVGGDGTFSEIVQGLVGQEDVTFGAVPAGTGNDFINILGFSDRFSAREWEIFFEENTVQMDVGKCNDRYFINGMGLGYDAQVAFENYEAENSRAVKGGSKAKYWKHILKTLVTYKERDMQVTYHEQTRATKAFLNTIAIGRRLAGGFYLTPRAIANDGLLDICMISELSLPMRVKELLRVMKQAHTEDAVVNYFTADRIVFEFGQEVPAHLDGEMYFGRRFEVGILPQHLKTIFNPYGKHFFHD